MRFFASLFFIFSPIVHLQLLSNIYSAANIGIILKIQHIILLDKKQYIFADYGKMQYNMSYL